MSATAPVARSTYEPDKAGGAGYLKVAGALCVILGLSELISALSRWWIIDFGFRIPWLDVMLSSGAQRSIVPFLAIALSAVYFTLGVMGVVFSEVRKLAKIQVFICISAFILHVGTLTASYFAGGFSYISVFFLAIPVIYFIGATQNTDNRKLKDTAIAYSFIAPNLIGFCIFTLIPMGFALVLGFMKWDLGTNTFTFIGLDNFARMRTDHLFWPSLRNTIQFTAITVPLTMVLALCLALLLNKQIRGRALFRGVMFFPYVASLIAMAAVWNQIFHPSWGPVNQFLTFLSGNERGPQWTTAPWVIPNIAFFTAWRNMGYYMIIYLAGLQSIPRELYEAAAIDGANRWNSFWRITLPQLRFVTFFVSVMLTIMCFRVFDQVLMITNSENPGSATTMMVVHIFRVAFVTWDFGYASAIALVLLVLVVGITIVQFLIQKRSEND